MGTKVNVKSIAVQSILLIFFVAFAPVIIVSFLGNLGITTIGIGLIISIVMAYLGYRVVKGIITPIGRLVAVTDKLAAGDLDTDLDTGSKSGELGQVNKSLAKMVANIKDRIQYSESILKGIMDPLYVVDPTGKITYVNEPGAKLFGASVQELTGKSLEDQFNIAETRSGDSYLTRCLRSGDVRNGFESMLIIKRTGKKITTRCSIAPVRDASGSITGAVELLQDISQVKEAEEAMQKAEREMKDKAAFSDGILKSIRDNHVVIDTAGKIIYMNEVALQTIGVPAKEAIGKRITDVTSFRDNGGKTLEALKTGQDIMGLKDEISLRNGTWLPVITNASIVRDAAGKITGLSIVARDTRLEKESKKQLRDIMKSANEIAERVADATGDVSGNVQQVMSASKQISDSIQQIASGSQTEARSIENINRLMHDMSTTIANVNAGARQTSEEATRANAEAKKSAENAQVAIRKMDELHSVVNDSAKIVHDLGEKSKKIGQIVDMITAIAGQTNLLALNAAIEAARAGDAGRGFAVVAEEVRKLAEDSAKAAEEINLLIDEVREQTALAVTSMNRGTQEVEASNRMVAQSLKSLEEISHMIDITSAKAQEIASMTEKQTADTERVVRDVEEMAAVIQESAAGAEQVSASSEETTSTAEHVFNMTNELAKVAEDLKAQVALLKVD